MKTGNHNEEQDRLRTNTTLRAQNSESFIRQVLGEGDIHLQSAACQSFSANSKVGVHAQNVTRQLFFEKVTVLHKNEHVSLWMLSARREHIYHSWAACDRTMSQEKNKKYILAEAFTCSARQRLVRDWMDRWQMERTSTPLYVTQEEVRVSLHPKEYRGCGGRRLTLSLTVENGAISNYSIICSALKKIMFCLYLSD